MRKFEKNEKVVVVVRHRAPHQVTGVRRIDLTQYAHPNIWAVIPCVEKDGKRISLKTGNEVPSKRFDEVRDGNSGMAFNYDDGTRTILTRCFTYGQAQFALDDRTCDDAHCIPIRCFGEELASAPKRE